MRTRLLTLLFLTISTLSTKAIAEDTMGEVFGDWTEFCEQTTPTERLCNISQTLTRQGSKDLLLSIRINYLPGSDDPVVFATLPLGGLLTYGPQLKVGTQTPLDMTYQFCDQSGCTAATVVNQEFLAALNKEIQAVVKFVNMERKAIGIPVSLIGFSKGMEKISPVAGGKK